MALFAGLELLPVPLLVVSSEKTVILLNEAMNALSELVTNAFIAVSSRLGKDVILN